jgi:hypothetical protein
MEISIWNASISLASPFQEFTPVNFAFKVEFARSCVVWPAECCALAASCCVKKGMRGRIMAAHAAGHRGMQITGVTLIPGVGVARSRFWCLCGADGGRSVCN